MARWVVPAALSVLLGASALAQVTPDSDQAPGENQPPPRTARDREAGESSSRNTQIDITPPSDDAKKHPFSSSSVADAEAGDVQEFHSWDPHKAAKNVEVGDFYFKKKNYRAALDRYREALLWKDNDAVANFRMGECLEKLNRPEEARAHYETYLKILPQGPLAESAHKALERLKEPTQKGQTTNQAPRG